MDINFIISSVGVFLAVILLLVVILLLAKKFLSPSGKVTITINGDKQLNVDQGSSIMATLNENGCANLAISQKVSKFARTF